MNGNVFYKSACKQLAVAVIKAAIHDGDVEWFTNSKSMFPFYLDLSDDYITKIKAVEAARKNAEDGRVINKNYALPKSWYKGAENGRK